MQDAERQVDSGTARALHAVVAQAAHPETSLTRWNRYPTGEQKTLQAHTQSLRDYDLAHAIAVFGEYRTKKATVRDHSCDGLWKQPKIVAAADLTKNRLEAQLRICGDETGIYSDTSILAIPYETAYFDASNFEVERSGDLKTMTFPVVGLTTPTLSIENRAAWEQRDSDSTALTEDDPRLWVSSPGFLLNNLDGLNNRGDNPYNFSIDDPPRLTSLLVPAEGFELGLAGLAKGSATNLASRPYTFRLLPPFQWSQKFPTEKVPGEFTKAAQQQNAFYLPFRRMLDDARHENPPVAVLLATLTIRRDDRWANCAGPSSKQVFVLGVPSTAFVALGGRLPVKGR